MKIGDRQIGRGHGVYIIAELGVNHDGSATRAMELVEHAHKAGADAIKLQYFETDRLMSKSAKLAAYQKAAGETDPIAMLRRLELPIEAMGPIVERAHALGMHAILTVFSTELVDLAEQLPWNAYKTASPDIVHRPLLERLARTGRPLIVSTGAATLDEVKRSILWLEEWRASGRTAIMQCVSCYPTPGEHAELGGIAALQEVFSGPVGYSDHTAGADTAERAVSCGARMLEKHLTYSKAATGPDHAASLEPPEMKRYCDLAQRAAATPPASSVASLFVKDKRVIEIEKDVRRVSRQSIVAARALRAGATIAATDLTIKRPGTGFLPFELRDVLGKKTARAIDADTVIGREDVS